MSVHVHIHTYIHAYTHASTHLYYVCSSRRMPTQHMPPTGKRMPVAGRIRQGRCGAFLRVCVCICRACTHFLQASGKRRGAPPMPPPPPAARRACLCAHIHMRLKARYILIPTGHLARRCQAQGSGLSHVQKDFDQAEAAQARSLPRCLSGGARSSLRALWPSVSPSVCPSNLCTCVQT